MEVLADIPLGIWVVVATFASTFTLRLLDKYLAKNVERRGERAQFVEELKGCNERIDALEAEVESWRTKFYTQQDECARLNQWMIKNDFPLPPQ